MEIIHSKPPIYEDIISAGMKPSEYTVYTYGNKLYVPSGDEVPADLMVHEEVHMKQQGDDPDAWWSRYLIDQFFRIDQETAAYAKQYAFICRKQKDREKRNRILLMIASQLAGPMYGNVISRDFALRAVKEKANVR